MQPSTAACTSGKRPTPRLTARSRRHWRAPLRSASSVLERRLPATSVPSAMSSTTSTTLRPLQMYSTASLMHTMERVRPSTTMSTIWARTRAASSSGRATSRRQVVGLHEPPRNTATSLAAEEGEPGGSRPSLKLCVLRVMRREAAACRDSEAGAAHSPGTPQSVLFLERVRTRCGDV
ncbi:uncharacterized protein IUM83_11202 [Phytophthora cinnamomi]|uniref:uncharacterized protein n=1 Tax=Phytophthora cinnamomi TaxID=4785 RepID=UPI003559477A|nr:hypothetical protein IUM83_11202 [Phytophthora cinnamomi]